MIAELTDPTALSPANGRFTNGTATPTSAVRTMDLPTARFCWTDDTGTDLTDRPDFGAVPVAGVRVSLRDLLGREIATTTTDQAGSYRFDDVFSGEYLVVFTVPSGGRHAVAEAASTTAPSTYWAGDSVVPTPIHTWTRVLQCFRLAGSIG